MLFIGERSDSDHQGAHSQQVFQEEPEASPTGVAEGFPGENLKAVVSRRGPEPATGASSQVCLFDVKEGNEPRPSLLDLVDRLSITLVCQGSLAMTWGSNCGLCRIGFQKG